MSSVSSSVSNKWLHCNVCFIYFEKDKLFRLTSCLHHICKNCFFRNSLKGKRCPVCKKTAGFVITSNDMDVNFLKLFDRRPMSFDWEKRRIDFQYAQKMSIINHIMHRKNKTSGFNNFIGAKKEEYFKAHQIHLKLQNYRIVLQTKLVDAKKHRTNSSYSTSSNLSSKKSRNTTKSSLSIGMFNETVNSSVHQRSANSSNVINSSNFFNEFQTPSSERSFHHRIGRLNLQSLKKK